MQDQYDIFFFCKVNFLLINFFREKAQALIFGVKSQEQPPEVFYEFLKI